MPQPKAEPPKKAPARPTPTHFSLRAKTIVAAPMTVCATACAGCGVVCAGCGGGAGYYAYNQVLHKKNAAEACLHEAYDSVAVCQCSCRSRRALC